MTEHRVGAHTAEQNVSWSRGDTGQPPSAWVGWIWFAAIMLMLLGFFSVIEGLVALFRRAYYVTINGTVLVFNLTTWGWIHLIIGALAVIAGVTLFTSGALWARTLAIVLVAINALAQLAFISAYPVWALIILAFDVVVLWALLAHGHELEAARQG